MNAHIGLHNNWDLHGGATVDGLNASVCDRCSRGGPLVRRARGVRPWFGVNGDNRRLLVPSLWVNLGYEEAGTRSVSLQPGLTLRLSTRFEARLGSRIYWNEDAAQWVANVSDEGGTHHLFARLDQRTLSANIRVNYTATPDLTFQFYGEPFVSRGTYADFRELSETPRAEAFDDRYVAFSPPESVSDGFRVRQLRTNLVMRWEYLPGSTLFLVWSHGRDASGGPTEDLSWGDEFGDLFDLQPRNTFLVKIAHWLSW